MSMDRRQFAKLSALAAATALSLAAQSIPKITYTDTKLKNGLRVIISEDRTAPVFAI